MNKEFIEERDRKKKLMSNRNDMTNGNPAKALIVFALPMVIGNLFQQLYNIVDTIVVGKFVGEEALAAVGASASVVFLFVAFATGMSMGCSVIIAQFYGAGRINKVKTAITTSLLAITGFSTLLMIIGLVFNKTILRWIATPAEVFDEAGIYLAIYFMGLVFLFVYNILNAIFNGLGRSKIPLGFLAFSSILNVTLDLVFVIVFHMGVAGVAWATLISQALAAILSLVMLLFMMRRMKTGEADAVAEDTGEDAGEERSAERKKQPLFDLSILKKMLAIAIPSALQQSIVAIGNVCIQALVNGYGAVVIAGYTAATKIDGIAIMPMVNVGNAVSTFTAQNMGAKRPERIRKGLRAGIIMGAVISLTITLSIYIWSDKFIGMFVDSSSGAQVISVGVEYLRVVSVFYVVMGVMNAFNGILRGSGDVKFFMASTLCNFSTRVIMAYLLAGTALGKSAVWWAIPLGWGIGLMVSGARYLSGKWKKISLV